MVYLCLLCTHFCKRNMEKAKASLAHLIVGSQGGQPWFSPHLLLGPIPNWANTWDININHHNSKVWIILVAKWHETIWQTTCHNNNHSHFWNTYNILVFGYFWMIFTVTSNHLPWHAPIRSFCHHVAKRMGIDPLVSSSLIQALAMACRRQTECWD